MLTWWKQAVGRLSPLKSVPRAPGCVPDAAMAFSGSTGSIVQGQERPCDDCDSALCLYRDCEYIFAAERAAVAVVCVCRVTRTARAHFSCATVKCKMRSMGRVLTVTGGRESGP